MGALGQKAELAQRNVRGIGEEGKKLGETFAAFQHDSTTFGVLDVNALGY